MTPSSYRSYLELADSADMATMESRLNCLAQAQGFPLSNATCVVSDPGGVRHSVRSVRTAPEAAREMIGDATSFRRDPCFRWRGTFKAA